MRNWNNIGANVTINIASTTTTTGSNSSDGNNSVFMTSGYDATEEGVWANTWCHSSSTSGLTKDCDIEFFTQQDNGSTIVTNTWTDSSSPSSSQMALDLMLQHELGHVLGFDENTVQGSAMFAGSSNNNGLGNTKPSLSSDDSAAITFLYGP